MRRIVALLFCSVPVTSISGTELPFLPASSCALCHLRIPPPGGEQISSVAPAALWRGSMMAHSSRDPFWRAKVRLESEATPAAARLIQDRCLRCHAPAAQYPRRATGGMALGDLDLADEGITCTVCHRIAPVNLGTGESYSGGFVIGNVAEIWGPHERPFEMPMLHHTGFAPVESKHILESSLCATCHTVITPTLTEDGRAIGDFLEQSPYLEWKSSSYGRAGPSCQGCHVRVLRDSSGVASAQYIAHMPPGRWFPPTRPRSPFGLHFFAGGNRPVLEFLADSEQENESALRQTAERTTKNLGSAVTLRASSGLDGRTLHIEVNMENRTGHKLPTGFPSRRIWLHVEAFATDGARVFESGGWDRATGRIRFAAAVEPHYERITRPEQVMIYQAVMADRHGRRTTSLLRAASYLKDNRIPPVGFAPGADRRITPVTIADDPGFGSGSHRVLYDIVLPARVMPARVRVEAVYQSLDPDYLPVSDRDPLTAATAAIPIAWFEIPFQRD